MKPDGIIYPSGWVRHQGIVAYPHGWQTPAKTEQWAYEEIVAAEPLSRYVQFVSFPWATLVDLLRQGRNDKAIEYLKALDAAPPKMAINRATVCQHIYALDLLPHFKRLGITDVFWAHKTKGQEFVEGIRLHPFPLYPVMFHKRDHSRPLRPLGERKFLYSFVGSYQPGLYLTQARRWIFDLPERSDAFVCERSEWHFEGDVYREQVAGLSVSEYEKKKKERWEQEYIGLMEDTIFCLCPSGSGPNSIRLWECLQFGCIPILISDDLDLPGREIIGSSIISVAESERAVREIPGYLADLQQQLSFGEMVGDRWLSRVVNKLFLQLDKFNLG